MNSFTENIENNKWKYIKLISYLPFIGGINQLEILMNELSVNSTIEITYEQAKNYYEKQQQGD